MLEFPLGNGPHTIYNKPWNIIHSSSCRYPRILLLHDNLFGPLGLLGFHRLVRSGLGRTWLLQPMSNLIMQWSWILQGLFTSWTLKSSQVPVKFVIGCWTSHEPLLFTPKKKCQSVHGVWGPWETYCKACIIHWHGPMGFVVGEAK